MYKNKVKNKYLKDSWIVSDDIKLIVIDNDEQIIRDANQKEIDYYNHIMQMI